MPLFVCSDLHLGDAGGARMFVDAEQGMRFAELCALVAKTEGELVLLGDIFDLTAATPPQKGLEAFARALEVPGLGERRRRTPAEVMADIRHANPQHGHAWDPSNATAQGGGEVMTSVLHHAVIPFLRHLQPRSNITIEPERVVALRPEERVVPVLERWLSAGRFEVFLDAFLELLVENGYVSRALSWLATPERNLGTWTARASDAAGPLELTLPVLELNESRRALAAHLRDFSRHPRTLQRFEVPR